MARSDIVDSDFCELFRATMHGSALLDFALAENGFNFREVIKGFLDSPLRNSDVVSDSYLLGVSFRVTTPPDADEGLIDEDPEEGAY